MQQQVVGMIAEWMQVEDSPLQPESRNGQRSVIDSAFAFPDVSDLRSSNRGIGCNQLGVIPDEAGMRDGQIDNDCQCEQSNRFEDAALPISQSNSLSLRLD